MLSQILAKDDTVTVTLLMAFYVMKFTSTDIHLISTFVSGEIQPVVAVIDSSSAFSISRTLSPVNS